MNADAWIENIPLHAKVYNAVMVVSIWRERHKTDLAGWD